MFKNELPSIENILADQSVSTWLKDSLRASLARDPVDAARDAELLSALLVSRADKQLENQD